MRSLLDSNFLLALIDSDHTFHIAAHRWINAPGRQVWASCPLTENGAVRIMANPSYSRARRFTIDSVIRAIRTFAEGTDHEFWTDSVSLTDPVRFDTSRIHGPRQITDLYLLALAVERSGRLVTFDTHVSTSAVRRATPENLIILSA